MKKSHVVPAVQVESAVPFKWGRLGLVLLVVLSAVWMARPHLTSRDIPYGDGWGFVARAIQMHGLLHTGQLQQFWELLIAPLTFTVLPTYVLFWCVPSAWASAALLVIHPAVQYSRPVYETNVKTVRYAQQHWAGPDGKNLHVLQMADGQPGVVIVVFPAPLTGAPLEAYLQALQVPSRTTFNEGEKRLLERRRSLREYWKIYREAKW